MLIDKNNSVISFGYYCIFFECLPQILNNNKLRLYNNPINNFQYSLELKNNYGNDNYPFIDNNVTISFDINKLKETGLYNIEFIKIDEKYKLFLLSNNNIIENIIDYISEIKINDFSHNIYINYPYIKELCDKNNIKLNDLPEKYTDSFNYKFIHDMLLKHKNIDISIEHIKYIVNLLCSTSYVNNYSLLISIIYILALIENNCLFQYKFDLINFPEELRKSVDSNIYYIINNIKNEQKTGNKGWRYQLDYQLINILQCIIIKDRFFDKNYFDFGYLLTYFINKKIIKLNSNNLLNSIVNYISDYIILWNL